MTISMDLASAFFEGRKAGQRKRLQSRLFSLFKDGPDLFSGRTVNPLFRDLAFPLPQEGVLLFQGGKSLSL